jgi:hypothetical protein
MLLDEFQISIENYQSSTGLKAADTIIACISVPMQSKAEVEVGRPLGMRAEVRSVSHSNAHFPTCIPCR